LFLVRCVLLSQPRSPAGHPPGLPLGPLPRVLGSALSGVLRETPGATLGGGVPRWKARRGLGRAQGDPRRDRRIPLQAGHCFPI
jgi:hypothetical protein